MALSASAAILGASLSARAKLVAPLVNQCRWLMVIPVEVLAAALQDSRWIWGAATTLNAAMLPADADIVGCSTLKHMQSAAGSGTKYRENRISTAVSASDTTGLRSNGRMILPPSADQFTP